jgi:hypothetical protein
MRLRPAIASLAVATLGLAHARVAFAGEAPTPKDGDGAAQPAAPSAAPAKPTAPPTTEKPEEPADVPSVPSRTTRPESAAAALIRAGAAYEYGDMNQMVEAARPVADGLLPASLDEQKQALRLLGIGLFLTNRPLGAESSFLELLRKDPKARLDPTTVRPELVAFFENVRRQQLSRERSYRRIVWNFLPPLGQFQNGDRASGWTLLAIEGTALATVLTTTVLFRKWHNSDNTAGTNGDRYDAAVAMKTTNLIANGVLAAAVIYGIIDGLVGYSRYSDDTSVSFRPTFDGAGLRISF